MMFIFSLILSLVFGAVIGVLIGGTILWFFALFRLFGLDFIK